MALHALQLFLPLTQYPYVGEPIACPVCGGEAATVVANLDRRFKRLSTTACDHCGLLYTNPMPTEDELSAYYAKHYRFDYQWAWSRPHDKRLAQREQEARIRIALTEDLLSAGARTLDFGCGSGEFVSQMTDKGFDAHGFEPGEAFGGYAQQRLGDRIRITGWREAGYDQPFDFITSFHVVEHLRDPLAALRRMTEWLAPNGLICIEVPNMGLESLNKGFGGLHFAHVVGFNHYNLLLAGQRVGFRPVRALSPTCLVFERGENADATDLARQGRELASGLYGNGNAYRNYVRYYAGRWTLPSPSSRRS